MRARADRLSARGKNVINKAQRDSNFQNDKGLISARHDRTALQKKVLGEAVGFSAERDLEKEDQIKMTTLMKVMEVDDERAFVKRGIRQYIQMLMDNPNLLVQEAMSLKNSKRITPIIPFVKVLMLGTLLFLTSGSANVVNGYV